MTKKDLLLIHSFIDSKNPKEVLNFAHLKDDGIYATDTKKCIMFSIPMLDLDLFLEKILSIYKGYQNINKKNIHESIRTLFDFDKSLKEIEIHLKNI